MNSLVLALALLGRVVAPTAVAREVWITVDRDVLSAFERGGEAWESTALGADVDLARPQVVAVGLAANRIDDLSAFVHERYHRCGGFMAHGSREEAQATASRAQFQEAMESLPPPVSYTIDNTLVAKTLVRDIQELNIRNTINALAAFQNRRHNCATGQQSALSIRDQWMTYAAGRPDVSVSLFTHDYGPTTPTVQPSVILTIQGTTFPSEVVVLGAHQDSINGSSCANRAPGADDDASGIAGISEVLRAAMTLRYQPARTVKFIAYAAEEIGDRGSQQVAQAHVDQGINVVGVLQLDMTNYRGTPNADIVFINDWTNAAQNAFLRELADAYIDVPTSYAPRLSTLCGYACSDHASWTNRGFAASFPFESTFSQSNPFIHTTNDTIAQSGNQAQHSLPFARLAAAYMAELAKGGFTALNVSGAPRTLASRALR